jgi:predicted DsbA family dithiol-disulfide isomerase
MEKIDPSRLAENLLSGYFADGLDIADRDVLIDIADSCGLSRSQINETLDNEQTRRMVLSQEAQVRQSGVSGVPAFLVNKRLFAIGAQSTESLVGIFDRTMFGEDSDLPVSPVVH